MICVYALTVFRLSESSGIADRTADIIANQRVYLYYVA